MLIEYFINIVNIVNIQTQGMRRQAVGNCCKSISLNAVKVEYDRILRLISILVFIMRLRSEYFTYPEYDLIQVKVIPKLS